MTTQRIAFIGFGEAAGAIVEGWGDPSGITAFDIKTESPQTAPGKRADYERRGVAGAETRGEALAEASLVFCTVTADRALAAAQECAEFLRPGTLWLDLNSCAPNSKRAAAGHIAASGGRYIDVAVMQPVYPKRHQVPLLLAGPDAAKVAAILKELDMAPKVASTEIGAASTIKMIRSVMIKGMEALAAECVLAAVKAGVDEAVLGSLSQTFPGIDWPKQVAYNLERMSVHGQRRAAELEEVAVTLQDLDLPSDMAEAIVKWQRRLGRTSDQTPAPDPSQGYATMARSVLEKSPEWHR